jgi:hypothetical protein
MTEPEKRPRSMVVPSRGPRMMPMPVDRIVKTYPVSEHELTTIGTLSFGSSFCFSIASGSAVFAASLWMGVYQELDVSNKNVHLVNIVGWAFLVIAVVFLGAGIACVVFRRWEWSKIKSEAVEERMPGASARDSSVT